MSHASSGITRRSALRTIGGSVGLVSLGTLGIYRVAQAATEVRASANLVNMFLSANSLAIPATSYTNATNATYGNIQILRSHPISAARGYPVGQPVPANEDGTVWSRLYAADTKGKTFSSVQSASKDGYNYMQVSDPGYPGECVGFAKYMAPTLDGTSSWHPGRALSNLLNTTTTYTAASAQSILPAGTVIAYFVGRDSFPGNGRFGQHVAIALSVALDSAGKLVGINVVDQNGISDGDGRIVKHLLPWNGGAQVGAKNYHIVAQ